MSVSDTGQGGTTNVDSGQLEDAVFKLNVTPTALVFVRVVPTVVVVVTLPAARHAAVVLASELVWLTRPLGCTNQDKRYCE